MCELFENSTSLYTCNVSILRIWDGDSGSNLPQTPIFMTVTPKKLSKLSHTALVNL